MSSKDTHDERDLGHDGLNRRNILLAGSTLAAASALSSSLSSAQQAGASGAYSNSAITMQPPGKEVPASQQERVLAAKIARAMLSGPREITKDATVAEMGADGNLIVLRQGTNDWVCFPGDENEIGNVPMCADPMGLQWMMDVRSKKPKPTNRTPGLIYMLCGATQHSYRPVRSNQSSYPDWSPLDDYLALRCQTLWVAQYREGRGRVGDVRWHSLRLSAHLRHAVGRK
jgi:hypothetical protein